MEMIDQEKLKKAFECCLTNEAKCWDCPYCKDSFSDCQRKLHDGVIELLKTQEAKKQEQKKVEWRYGRAYCPECGELFPRKKDTQYIRFCSYCGQAVRWND